MPRFALLRRRHPAPLWPALALAVLVPSAGAAAPVAGRFDLAAAPRPLLTGKWLHDRRHVPQSFAFDDAGGHVYVLQVEGANAAGTFQEHAARGDLVLTRLTADGTVAGHMILRGFGHGVALGVEPGADGGAHLWTEVDAQPNEQGVGRGTRLARFPFRDGLVLAAGSAALEKFDLVPGARACTPSLDLAHGRLALRYARDGIARVALYDLATVKAGPARPLREIPLTVPLGVVQGWCAFGDHLYFLTGGPYSAANPPPGNATLWCLDGQTGAVVARAAATAFRELEFREPEGLAVQWAGGAPRLCFGFGAAVSATDSRRQISIAFLSDFIPTPVTPP